MSQQWWMGWKRWKVQTLAVLFAIALTLTLLLSPGSFSLAQDSPPATKEEFVQDIEAWAKRDAQLDNLEPSEAVQQAYRKFGDNPFELEEPDIYDIYIEAFIAERDRLEGDLWENLPINWISAIVIFFLGIGVTVAHEKLTAFANAVWDWIYQRIAGNPLFLNLALRKYQETLKAKLTNLDTPFKIEPPLAMAEVYVPLKIKQVTEEDEARAQTLSQGTELDIYAAMKRHKRLMVTGPPGSGKSVLLKHIAFKYGNEKRLDLPGQPIPVRLELNSLRSADLDEAQFIGKLVDVLDTNGFPKAERFVAQGLESGKLLLLLDGLDEVPSEVRNDVVVVMNGVLERYGDCPAIVTCRTAVYKREFDVVLDRNLLEVVEFTDYQIRNFLQAWKSRMPAEKSVEQLMQTLQDRPKIKTLARNPLLLTIITYLYTETTFVLPHSRAEFYEKATNMLLELRDQERNIKDSLNRYSTVAKRQVLRRLALVAQDTLNPENPDRRSITRQVVWREVGQVLPDLNLAVEETGGILQEIIARSGLLLEIDGGERFQFAHLTLQEFFAAAALQNDQVGLIERFERDAVAWREVVKLWCGLVGNSTELIRAIYKQDELLAFECLAEAQEVEQALADEIFERMKGELERAATEDEVAKAFGSVAADTQKPRGKTTLEFLQEQLRKAPDTATRIAAAKGLSMTNLPESAYVLAEHYQDSMDNIVSAPLVRMGDIAVEPVYGAARKGYLEAIDDLFCIHTPRVAQELTRLIWNKDEQLASRAAWRLAAMLEKSNVEQELTTIEGLPDFGYGEFDWIWLPFTTSQKSNLCVIAGQLVKLISANSELPEMMASADSEKKGIDLRLLVPICVFSDNGIKRFSISEEKAKKVERLLEQRGSHVGTGIEFNLNVDQLLNSAKVEHSWKILLESKNPFLRVDLTYRLSDQYREIEKQDWLNIFKKNTFDFSRSRMYWVILIIAFIASVGAIAQILLFMMQQPENPLNGLMAIANIAIFVYCLSVWQGIEERFELNTFDKLGFFGILTLWRESKSLLFTKKTLWQGVRLVWKALFSVFENRTESERKLLDFLFLVGVGFGLTSLSFFSSVLMTMAVSNFGFIFGILIGAKFRFYELKTMGFRVEFKFNIVNLNWAIFVCAAVTGFMIWTVNGSVAEALGWITGSLFGRGIGIWNEAYENQQLEHPEPIPLWQKLIALCAFPLYCWFPITTVFFLLGLKNLLTTLNTPHPWWFATGIWLTLFITCCILWVWGQRKDRAARNPLHGILDDYYPQYKMQRNP